MTPANPFIHDPVLLGPIMKLLEPITSGSHIDFTVGGAGHAKAVLDAQPGRNLLGLDQDRAALAAAGERLAAYGDRVALRHTRFDRVAEVVVELGERFQPITSILMDLGVSSPQFDRAERGFSYRLDGVPDMRMDPDSGGPTAAELLNNLSTKELAQVLREGGDERFAMRIAERIVANRPIVSTLQLAEIIKNAIPAATRRHGGHPAKRSFQALRLRTNDELPVLNRGIDAALELLAPGGRLLIISFHSGEDRIVKSRFRTAESGGCTCPPTLPCVCGAVREFRLLKRGGWTADEQELRSNPRSASARLRAIEKLHLPNEVRS